MNNNRLVALIFRIFAFLLSLVAIIGRILPCGQASDFGALLYLTLQTNALILLFTGYLAVRNAVDLAKTGIHGSSGYNPRVQGALALLGFFVVLVYWALLARTKTNLFSFVNIALHGFAPFLFIADYYIFNERGHMKKWDPLLFALIPIAYFIQASIVGVCGYVFEYKNGTPVHYPYFFVDYDRIGALALAYIGGIGVVYVGVALVMYAIDKKLGIDNRMKKEKRCGKGRKG
jgi:hypothetical protein